MFFSSKKLRRIVCTLVAWLMVVVCVGGCATDKAGNGTTEKPIRTPGEQPKLLGFICSDSDDITTCLALHGFLRTAENLAMSAKVYRITETEDVEAMAHQAIGDGCDGVILSNGGNDSTKAVDVLCQAGVSIVTLMDDTDISEINAAAVSIDDAGVYSLAAMYLGDLLRVGMITRGTIAVYGDDSSAAEAKFVTAVGADSNYGYSIVSIKRPDDNNDSAVSLLKQHLNEQGEMAGVFATSPTDALVAATAANGIKAISPAASISPDNRINDLPVIGMGLDDTAQSLFDAGLSALCVRPVYEAAVQATLTLCEVASGENYQKYAVLSWHIATADTIEKYESIYNNALIWFGQKTPAPVVPATLSPSLTPNISAEPSESIAP